jgi:mannose-1-phosphate guanylyltransferase/mannose-6-phosphate isomerase
MGVETSSVETADRDFGLSNAIRPVILCGGTGTRLWPMSRSLYPKQLLALTGTDTMLQATAARVAGPPFESPVLVAGEEHRFLVKDQLETRGLPAAAVLLEPEGRNTAAAIAIAAQWIAAAETDEMMLVMPSDHVVNDVAAFHAAIAAVLPAVEAGAIATFGIKPRVAETGYGYIEADGVHPQAERAFTIARFVEKPDAATAQSYLEKGNFYWNGGIFLFKASVFLDELREHAPAIFDACKAAMDASRNDGPFVRPDKEAFLASPSISVDYAVMEHTKRGCVVPVEMGWSDVGSWNALWEVSEKDRSGNAIQGDVIAVDTSDSLLRSHTNQTIASVGLKDLAVIATRDAVLIMPRERAQDAKLVVDALKGAGRDTHLMHAQVHRPWGTYETMDMGDRFQTKRIVVKPGQKLSLQKHHHRSEHWIIVNGTARVTVGEEVFLLQENQSTYIPAGTVHRLENPGRIPLHLIEVQCGPYLGEDDIVRLEDSYGRLD